MAMVSFLERLKSFVVFDLLNQRFPLPVLGSSTSPNIRIFVMRHKAGVLPSCFVPPTYVPLNLGGMMATEGMSDNVGENISSLNPYLNEMTGIWWVAKHYAEIGAPEYVGFNHYRRFLDWSPTLLKKDTAFVSASLHWRRMDFLYDSQLAPLFADEFRKEFHESEYADIEKYMSSRIFYTANMFITDRNTFFRYFCFMERVFRFVFRMYSEHTIEVDKCSSTQRRVYGYFMEGMTSYWFYHESHTMHRIRLIRSRIRRLESSR